MQDDRQNKIRQRAYDLWHNEGRQDGRAEDYWAQAEREIDAEHGVAAEAGSELPAVQADSGTVTPAPAKKASTAAKKSGNGIAPLAGKSAEGPRKRRGAQSPRPA
jgi:hypothetical protein